MRDDTPSFLVKAIGAAIFVSAALFIAAYLFASEWLFWKLMTVLPFVFILFTAAPYGASNIADAINWKEDRALVKQQKALELARLQLEYARLKDAPLEAKAATVIDNADERQRLEQWRTYWITVMTWSLAHGSVVSWRNGLQPLMSYPDWRDSIVLPFIRMGWLTPIYQGSKSKLADGVTVGYILNELSAMRCPTAPYGVPPVLLAEVFQHEESQSNSSERLSREFA